METLRPMRWNKKNVRSKGANGHIMLWANRPPPHSFFASCFLRLQQGTARCDTRAPSLLQQKRPPPPTSVLKGAARSKVNCSSESGMRARQNGTSLPIAPSPRCSLALKFLFCCARRQSKQAQPLHLHVASPPTRMGRHCLGSSLPSTLC